MPSKRRPNSSTPPMGLRLTPTGLAIYEFKGVITAEGVTLPEAVNNEAPESLNTVEWLSGGQVMEDIFGGGSGSHSFLNLRANWQQHRESAMAKLEAVTGGGILCRIIISAEPAVQGISAQIGSAGVTLINGIGNSSFPQLHGGGAARKLLAGTIGSLGEILNNTGNFTITHSGTGLYTVALKEELASAAVVTASCVRGSVGFATATTESKTGFVVETRNTAGTLANLNWAFQAIG